VVLRRPFLIQAEQAGEDFVFGERACAKSEMHGQKYAPFEAGISGRHFIVAQPSSHRHPIVAAL
jgi:hypothetical protein